MTKEEIKTMTKEERKRQLEWSDPYEFGTVYAEYLLEENQQLKEHLERYEIIIFNLKEQLKKSEKARKEAIELINNINDWEICSKYDCMYKDDVLDMNDYFHRIPTMFEVIGHIYDKGE